MLRKFGRTACSLVLAFALVVGLNPAAALAVDGATSAGAIVSGTSSAVEGVSSIDNYGYIPDNTPAKSIHDGSETKKGKLRALTEPELPSKYDSRTYGHVTTARNQGSLGTCWAFATIGAIEASLLAHDQVTDASSLDLSERHLIYFMYNAVADPLGNTAGDKTTMVAQNGDYLKAGGNEFMAAYSLATWQGTVEESVAPYNQVTGLSNVAVDDSLAYSLDNYHLRDMRRIAMSDTQDVKKAIMEYGAAATGVCSPSDNKYFATGSDSQKYLYAYEKVQANHSILLVGWDDSISRENFGSSEATRPEHNGAWLAKNSWGAGWGDGGFFWISYDDKCLTAGVEKATVFSMGDVDEFDNVYQYDGTGRMASFGISPGGSIANVFTAKASEKEKLKAVSFALDDPNVSYSIQVYLNLTNSKNPTSGTPALSSPVQGKTSYAGYYTVDLPSDVSLSAGTSYSVVVTLSRNDTYVYYCCDSNSSGSDLTFTNSVAAGQSFERSSASGVWKDLATTKTASARIKAFTTNVENPVIPPVNPSPVIDPSPVLNPSPVVDPSPTLNPSPGLDPTPTPTPGPGPVTPEDPQNPKDPGSSASQAEQEDPAESSVPQAAPLSQKLTVAKAQLSKSVSVKKLEKSARYTSKVVVKGAKTKLTYKKISGSKRLSIGKTNGKIKVKKGTKKGKYKIRVRAYAASDPTYSEAVKDFTVVVRVK